MGDDDFNLDELINAHSAKVIEQDSEEEESIEQTTDSTVDINNLTESESTQKSAEDLLDYDISDEINFDEDISLDNQEIEILDTLADSEFSDESEINTLSDYANWILQKIQDKKLPPTPENYQIYFNEFIQAQNTNLQKQIYKIIDNESLNVEQQQSREFEQSIEKSLKLTQQLLSITTKVHGNINIMKNIIYKRENELTVKNSGDIVRLLKFDLGKLEGILNKQSGSMKNIYSRSVETVNQIQERTIFDKQFGVYNRRHFLDSLKNEVQKMKFFNYQSSIVLIIPHRSLTSIHLTPKIAFIIAKTLSKILLEHFSRNDIIAYYGNNIFGILVTHSALDVTEEKIEKLLLTLKKSSLFISGKEIELKVKIGVSELMSHIKTETSLLKTLDALKIANRSQETYHIL